MSGKNELTRMTVSLSSAQKDYVRKRAAATGCSTPSEYIRRLIHADQEGHEQEELELKITEGLDSPPREMTGKEWSKLRHALRAKLAKKTVGRVKSSASPVALTMHAEDPKWRAWAAERRRARRYQSRRLCGRTEGFQDRRSRDS